MDNTEMVHVHSQSRQSDGALQGLAREQQQESVQQRLPTVKLLAQLSRIDEVTYPLVVEASISVQKLKQLSILSAAKEIHVCYFEITPEMTIVPNIAICISIPKPAEQRPERPRKIRWIYHRVPHRLRLNLMLPFVTVYLVKQRRYGCT